MTKNKNPRKLRYLVAGYGLPAEFLVTQLFSMGVPCENIAVLTHDLDDRNSGLHSLIKLRGIRHVTDSARTDTAFEFSKRFNPDLIFSMHYRERIPDSILRLAPMGGVNLHPSLLPRYRGTNSAAWVIINGEKETGFTYHRMTADFDAGNILVQEKIEIFEWDTAFSLFNRLIVKSMFFLETVLEKMISEDKGFQQEGEPTYFPRKLPFDGKIDPTWSDEQVGRFIRALIFPPFPGATMAIDGRVVELNSFEDYLVIKGSEN